MGAVRRFFRARGGALALLAVLAVAPFVPPFNAREDLVRWLTGAALLGGLAVAFDFTAGYINIVNFGFAAFSGAGGYASALLALRAGLPLWMTVFLGAAFAALLGFLTGIVTLRLRGIYAAVVAWFLGLALMGVTRNLVDLTRGSLGLITPTFLGTAANRPYYFLALLMLAVTYFTLKGVTESHLGLAFRAIGQNLDVARASGVDPVRVRLLNFMLSCFFAGWLGGFYAHYYGILTPAVMDTSRTVEILAVAYIGGRGSLWGGAVVAFPFVFLLEWLRSTFSGVSGLHLILYGLMLIFITLFYPGGLAELARSLHGRGVTLHVRGIWEKAATPRAGESAHR
jgi:branched-chain amino acid transport system permease protein